MSGSYPHEVMDELATLRYQVKLAKSGGYHKYAVYAGDGEQELYRGSESDCRNVARKLIGAFLDGGFTVSLLEKQGLYFKEGG